MLDQFPSGKQFTVSYNHLNQRLDNFLLSRLKGLPKSCLYRLIRQGKIKVNQKRSKLTYRLQAGDIVKIPRLHLDEPKQPPSQISSGLQSKIERAILFEDDHLIVLNKPEGLAVHGGSGINLGVIEALRYLRPTQNYLELAHRLDRDTSGCLLIAKKISVLRQLHALLRNDEIEKTYLSLVCGHWPTQLKTIDMPLKKNQMLSGERIVRVDQAGKACLTEFQVLKHFKSTSLLAIKPRTGRTHQIRVHAQQAGYPIAGDEKYGDRILNQTLRKLGLNRLFLHAYQLKFRLSAISPFICMKAELPVNLQALLEQPI